MQKLKIITRKEAREDKKAHLRYYGKHHRKNCRTCEVMDYIINDLSRPEK